MWPQQPMYNQYMPPQMLPPQSAIVQQAIQQVQKSAQFYTVESAQELDGIKPALNVLYVGFNKNRKEIYLKQLTNDGLVSTETYSLAGERNEKSALDTVLEKINELERKLTNERNNSNAGSEVPQRATSEPTTDATGQTNVAGQKPATTTPNAV